MNLFPLSRCASATKIVRPSESIAETQPRHQPDALRLSAMKRVVDAIERVTAVLLFAGCALHRWSLHYRHEFVNYCSIAPAASC